MDASMEAGALGSKGNRRISRTQGAAERDGAGDGAALFEKVATRAHGSAGEDRHWNARSYGGAPRPAGAGAGL